MKNCTVSLSPLELMQSDYIAEGITQLGDLGLIPKEKELMELDTKEMEEAETQTDVEMKAVAVNAEVQTSLPPLQESQSSISDRSNNPIVNLHSNFKIK